MGEFALSADRLSVKRGGLLALRDVSFEVRAGEVFALLGGNGAGKSTTLLSFLGLLKPEAGEARVLGQSAHENVADARKQIAYLPEAATLYPHMSAEENISYFLSLAGVRRDKSAINAALERVALQPAARAQRMERYSKGMRQKVAIALALLREAPILLLDEPTSGLDPIAIDDFNILIGDLARSGSTVLMVTHDVYGACQVASRIGLLRAGELVGVFDAPADGRIDTDAVHAAFAGRAAS
ncbi:MAG: ABC transporter ATP-binding protein [Hyphomonas sp.]|jgi:ABC-2 type transport system ATP-binding protein|uniref:ABC transporter ATP-binding protein n=1 Tax=Hyphomonas sp. TaxID=87 RepID=UPI0025C6A77D|nr:ABC transporter ATP-binding protein [Hyphomonas sp.]MBA4339986.1 ABC transporter ATP-binding protein [Hyphomonas sp.]